MPKPTKRYVVQVIANGGRAVDLYNGDRIEHKPCSEFDSLDYARRHCRLNGGGTIWNGADVVELYPSGCISHHREAKPLEHIW